MITLPEFYRGYKKMKPSDTDTSRFLLSETNSQQFNSFNQPLKSRTASYGNFLPAHSLDEQDPSPSQEKHQLLLSLKQLRKENQQLKATKTELTNKLQLLEREKTLLVERTTTLPSSLELLKKEIQDEWQKSQASEREAFAEKFQKQNKNLRILAKSQVSFLKRIRELESRLHQTSTLTPSSIANYWQTRLQFKPLALQPFIEMALEPLRSLLMLINPKYTNYPPLPENLPQQKALQGVHNTDFLAQRLQALQLDFGSQVTHHKKTPIIEPPMGKPLTLAFERMRSKITIAAPSTLLQSTTRLKI